MKTSRPQRTAICMTNEMETLSVRGSKLPGVGNGSLQHGPQGARAVLFVAIEKEDSDEK